MPLFFLSGAMFPIEGLPKALATIVKFNPLSYGVDALRGMLINVTHFGLHIDAVVLVTVTVFFLAVGSYSFSKIQV
jgi:ABC-2 type transport system permease protein